MNLGAIQVWYKVETNCCGVRNEVWKSWEVQFLELLARESRTVPPSQRLSSGARQDSELRAQELQSYLDRRRPGSNRHGTPRHEDDQVVLLSGIYSENTSDLFRGRTLPFERANWRRDVKLRGGLDDG